MSWKSRTRTVDASTSRAGVRSPATARLGAARTDQGEGSGLGLSIARAIALAHGAEVDARALPEGGLDVEARFPLAPARDADQAADHTA